MRFIKKRSDQADRCFGGVRNDLWQFGQSAEFCNEIASLYLRAQFEELSRSNHLAKDVGLKR